MLSPRAWKNLSTLNDCFAMSQCIRLDECEGKTYIHLSRCEGGNMSEQLLDSVKVKVWGGSREYVVE